MKKFDLQEVVGYICIGLLVIGNITVGKFYLFAQIVYLVANGAQTVRSFALDQPKADKLRNVIFTGITVALIIATIWR